MQNMLAERTRQGASAEKRARRSSAEARVEELYAAQQKRTAAVYGPSPGHLRRGKTEAGLAETRISANGKELHIQYRVREQGDACIVHCASQAPRVDIPAALEGHAVTELVEGSCDGLARCERITCPDTLRRIGARAFVGCMGLREVVLNDGLEEIGEEAFAACFGLRELLIPASVKRTGARIVGALGESRGMMPPTEIRISPDNEHLIARESGLVYARGADGLVLIDGSRFESTVLRLEPGVVEIGPSALGRNKNIKKVVLPEGVRCIGESAFRGCASLTEIVIPESLQEIQAGAFSCTKVASVYLPAGCVRVHEDALCTGPVFSNSTQLPFSSCLREIRVHPDNPLYCMRGPVLCKRVCACAASGTCAGEECELRAVLCPGYASEVDLTSDISSVDGAAFAGSCKIDTLRLRDGIRYSCPCTLLPHGGCNRVVVELALTNNKETALCLDVPEGSLGAQMMEQALTGDHFDAKQLLAAYDEALEKMGEGVAQARRMAARLAAPVHLAKHAEERFSQIVREAFWSLCAYFGARNSWQGFDSLAEAGVLDAGNISEVIGRLSAAGYALAAGYLLDVKRRRFGRVALDYGI